MEAADHVPETKAIAQKRRANANKRKLIAKRRALKTTAGLERHAIIAEKRLRKEHRINGLKIKKAKMEARKSGKVYVPAEPKLILAVRIRGITAISPKVRSTLRLLRLRNINSATFVPVNKATLNMLKIVEPYVAYGYPTLGTVKKLLLKRGYAKINGQRVPLTNNHIIASRLSNKGVCCMSELIHEIATVGPNFTACNRFLYPMHLNNPLGGKRAIGNHFVEGGDCGNRKGLINNFVRKML